MRKCYRKSRLRNLKFIILQIILIFIIIILSKELFQKIYPQLKESGRVSLSGIRLSGKNNTGKDTAADYLSLKGNDLTSRNAILVRLQDHKILFAKNSNETIYPASLTKIMTAIVAIEHLKDLKQTILLSPGMFQTLYNEDASMAGFKPGESTRAIDLLYGALLPSGAECCIGLADHIAGSQTAFVSLMNKEAKDLGMSHTHFTNATGLNNPDHYTTVKDLSLLLEHALQNNTFRKIFTSSRHTIDSTNIHPEGFTFFSTLFSKLGSPDFKGGSILGGKTGYTNEAGLCLASLAKVDGKEYILITTGAKGDHDSEQYNIDDALTVYKSLN